MLLLLSLSLLFSPDRGFSFRILPQIASWYQTPKPADTTKPSATPQPQTKEVKVFISYSHIDEEYREKLEMFLKILRKSYPAAVWGFEQIGAGQDYDKEIEAQLSTADIILLLVSQDFLASDYCYDKEMLKAMARHEAKEAVVIPIILRPSLWRLTHFRKLQALPKHGKPITLWSDRDEAFLDAAEGVLEKMTKG